MEDKKQFIENQCDLADRLCHKYWAFAVLDEERRDRITELTSEFKKLPWELLESVEGGENLYATIHHNFAHILLPLSQSGLSLEKILTQPVAGEKETIKYSVMGLCHEFQNHLFASAHCFKELLEQDGYKEEARKADSYCDLIVKPNKPADNPKKDPVQDKSIEDLEKEMSRMCFNGNPKRYANLVCQIVDKVKAERGLIEAIEECERYNEPIMKYIFVQTNLYPWGNFDPKTAYIFDAVRDVREKLQGLYKEGFGGKLVFYHELIMGEEIPDCPCLRHEWHDGVGCGEDREYLREQIKKRLEGE